MTAFGAFASIVWAVVVLTIAYRLEFVVLAIAQDWLNNAYRAGKPLPPQKPSKAEITIPDDLEAVALAESEAWAQNDLRVLLREKFLEYHTGDSAETWQKVRRAIGIGEMPT